MPPLTDLLHSPQHHALMQATALAGRSAEIEAQRCLPQDIADSLAAAGLYRLLTQRGVRGGGCACAAGPHGLAV